MKQAFLIIAHNKFEHLCRLIDALDSPEVWFYIHVDAKVEIPDSLAAIRTSNPIKILHSQRVRWGHRSQVVTELELLAEAYGNKEIQWFHLISGTDFPLRPVPEILRFYEEAADTDCFMETQPVPPLLADRMEIYHFGENHPNASPRWIKLVQSKFRALQVRMGIRRKAPVKGGFRYGSNWVDLRRNAVEALLRKKDSILRTIRYTSCSDEIYKQTFLHDCGLRIVNDNLRYIDWSGGGPSPKSLGSEDYDAMMSGGKLFARKFDGPDSPRLRDMITGVLRP